MSKGVNKVILIGNIGQDPEVRYTPQGSAIATVSIATSETWKDKTTGQPQERTEWHRAVFFNRLAEIVGEHCRKGAKLYLEGSLRTRKWQDQQGQDRYTTEIIGNEMQMLNSLPQSQAPQPPPRPAARPPSGKPSPHPQHAGRPPHAPPPDFDGFDDDIPF